MTTTTTSITANSSLFPFTGMDATVLDRSSVPQAEVIFKIFSGAVTVGGSGNEQRLNLTCEIPRNYAYALVGVYASITVVNGLANTWDDQADLFIVDAVGSDRSFEAHMNFTSGAVFDTLALPRKTYGVTDGSMGLVKTIVVPPPNSTGQKFGLSFENLTQDGPAALVQLFARCLLFTIEQSHHFAVNTPTLVR